MLLKIPPLLVNIQFVLCLLNKQFNSLARIPICVALYYLTSYREVHTPLVFFFVNIDVYPTVCIFTCIYIYMLFVVAVRKYGGHILIQLYYVTSLYFSGFDNPPLAFVSKSKRYQKHGVSWYISWCQKSCHVSPIICSYSRVLPSNSPIKLDRQYLTWSENRCRFHKSL